jgi:hypothetical protein
MHAVTSQGKGKGKAAAYRYVNFLRYRHVLSIRHDYRSNWSTCEFQGRLLGDTGRLSDCLRARAVNTTAALAHDRPWVVPLEAGQNRVQRAALLRSLISVNGLCGRSNGLELRLGWILRVLCHLAGDKDGGSPVTPSRVSR